jgi:hypothetical protein
MSVLFQKGRLYKRTPFHGRDRRLHGTLQAFIVGSARRSVLARTGSGVGLRINHVTCESRHTDASGSLGISLCVGM